MKAITAVLGINLLIIFAVPIQATGLGFFGFFFGCWYFNSVFSADEYPQLLLQLPRQNERICLNINKTAQTSVQLVSDPVQGEWATLPQYQGKESHWVCECSWCFWE